MYELYPKLCHELKSDIVSSGVCMDCNEVVVNLWAKVYYGNKISRVYTHMIKVDILVEKLPKRLNLFVIIFYHLSGC